MLVHEWEFTGYWVCIYRAVFGDPFHIGTLGAVSVGVGVGVGELTLNSVCVCVYVSGCG